ncbi:hypothetical protein OsJ_22687 [Oryza sativa Japonica Group]|uniref:Uncharacterized protein n=1 Tax=Oryza sativa subsp. japonica TaxID=39947 RepID=B9FQY0_ORYSJ|nr:hypothetical protein OsJ_22687 [Oryza sativa Japonica Group]
MIERSNSTPSATPARPPLAVDEEYNQAFRSKSFLDLWSHAHHHLTHTFSSFKLSTSTPCAGRGGAREDDFLHAGGDGGAADDSEQSCSYTVLDDFVLEPSPESLARGARLQQRRRRRPRRHRVETLLIEYFDVTEEACEACSALLAAIGAARRHHLTLRRLLLRLDGGDDDDAKDALARHVRLDNPLSPGSLSEFHTCTPGALRWRRPTLPRGTATAGSGRGMA